MTPLSSKAVFPSEVPLEVGSPSELAFFTAALVRGDEKCWATFYDCYRPRLLGYLVRSWSGEATDLDDLLQETLVRAVRHMRVFQNEDALWCWLTVLARSVVKDHGRKRKRWWGFLNSWRLEAQLRAIPGEPAVFAERLSGALAELEQDDRTLLEAKYFQRCSVRALAEERGVSVKAVEGRLSRARQKLARLMAQQRKDER